MLTDEINAVQDAAAEVQKRVDEENGIGLNSVRADFPEDRVAGIIDKLDKSESIEEVRQYLGEPIVNLLEASFDSWVQANAESRYKAGLESIVIRMAHNGACAWCRNLAGTYDYETVRYGSNVWRRHQYCRCVVIYENGKIRQSAWSRKIWQSSPEELERRRNAGNDLFRMTPELLNEINANLERDREVARLMRENPGLEKDRARYRVNRYGIASDLQRKVLDNLANNPEKLKMNVNILKRFLDENGFDVKPLNSGAMKGVDFKDGGGFRVNIGGDGVIQYRPATKNRVAYFKITTPEHGTHRYDTNGKEILTNAAGQIITPVSHTTIIAEPNSITQYTAKKGGIDRNYYGADGKQTKQISNNDHGHKEESKLGKHGEHAHDYTWTSDKTFIRGKARELTDDERRDNHDFL